MMQFTFLYSVSGTVIRENMETAAEAHDSKEAFYNEQSTAYNLAEENDLIELGGSNVRQASSNRERAVDHRDKARRLRFLRTLFEDGNYYEISDHQVTIWELDLGS